jgi:hypothetical protein
MNVMTHGGCSLLRKYLSGAPQVWKQSTQENIYTKWEEKIN